MELNRHIARVIDAVILVGLTAYAGVTIFIVSRGGEPHVQPLLIWVSATWIAPSFARWAIVPPVASKLLRSAGLNGTIADSSSRWHAYSDARDMARPHVYMLLARWIVVPLGSSAVFFIANQRQLLVASFVQAIIFVVLFAAFFRGTLEAVSFIATMILPRRAREVRRRAERTWNIVYFAGIPLLLLSRLAT